MTEIKSIDRRELTWQSEIERLEQKVEEHCTTYERMHIDTNSALRVSNEAMAEILVKLGTIEDIIVAWNRVKTLGWGVRILGQFIKWVVSVGIAIGAIWWWLFGRGQ